MKKRILSIILMLAMVMSLVSAMGIIASAASQGDTCSRCYNGTYVWANVEEIHCLECNNCGYYDDLSIHCPSYGEKNEECTICYPKDDTLADGTGDINLTLSYNIAVGDTAETIAEKIGGYDTSKMSLTVELLSTDYEVIDSVTSVDEQYMIVLVLIMKDLNDSFDSTVTYTYNEMGGYYAGTYNHAITVGGITPTSDNVFVCEYDTDYNTLAGGSSSGMVCNAMEIRIIAAPSDYTSINTLADGTGDINLTLTSAITVGDTAETIAEKITGYDTNKMSLYVIIRNTDNSTAQSIQDVSIKYIIEYILYMNNREDSFDSTLTGDDYVGYYGTYNHAVTVGGITPDYVYTGVNDIREGIHTVQNVGNYLDCLDGMQITVVAAASEYKYGNISAGGSDNVDKYSENISLSYTKPLAIGDTTTDIASKLTGYDSDIMTAKVQIMDTSNYGYVSSLAKANNKYYIDIYLIMKDNTAIVFDTTHLNEGHGNFSSYNASVSVSGIDSDDVSYICGKYFEDGDDFGINVPYEDGATWIDDGLKVSYAISLLEQGPAVTPSFVDITPDSGYYADKADGTSKEGIIAFTSQFNDFASYDVTKITKFGMMVYNTDDNKIEISSNSIDELSSASAAFYYFVTDIASANFDVNMYALPYIVYDGVTYYGSVLSSKVNAAKWLGDKATYSPVN